MKEERLKVLKMVDDGKISVDDAMKLMDSLKAHAEAGLGDFGRTVQSADMEEKLNKFSQSVDSFAKDFSDKMSTAFKDMEPRLRQATKTVVEKTAGVVDDISKSLNESLKTMENRVDNFEKDEECCCKEEDCCKEDSTKEECSCEEQDTPKEN